MSGIKTMIPLEELEFLKEFYDGRRRRLKPEGKLVSQEKSSHRYGDLSNKPEQRQQWADFARIFLMLASARY